MDTNSDQVKEIASQLLSGMLSNPHIYAVVSEEGSRGRQEQNLVSMAVEMAEMLIAKVDEKSRD